MRWLCRPTAAITFCGATRSPLIPGFPQFQFTLYENSLLGVRSFGLMLRFAKNGHPARPIGGDGVLFCMRYLSRHPLPTNSWFGRQSVGESNAETIFHVRHVVVPCVLLGGILFGCH